MDKLINGKATNVTDQSKQLGLKSGYVTGSLSLNSLAPDIVEAILSGLAICGDIGYPISAEMPDGSIFTL